MVRANWLGCQETERGSQGQKSVYWKRLDSEQDLQNVKTLPFLIVTVSKVLVLDC